jgi:hypothetical protein
MLYLKDKFFSDTDAIEGQTIPDEKAAPFQEMPQALRIS